MNGQSTAPDTFLGIPVPDDIKLQWKRWEAAAWRSAQHRNRGRLYPPDERFNVRLPNGMCVTHRQMWLDCRNMHFDPITGDAWPGIPGSPFLFVGHDMRDLRESRRHEWDEKASIQMRQIERLCLAGGSPQCSGTPEPIAVAAPRTVEDVHLPELKGAAA